MFKGTDYLVLYSPYLKYYLSYLYLLAIILKRTPLGKYLHEAS